jgi:hypothetical protein
VPPRPRSTRPKHYALWLADAAGPSIHDFFALGHSSSYDADFAHLNPATAHSPTSRFTHVLHYSKGVRDSTELLNDRLLTIWRTPDDEVLTAGFPHGVYRVALSGLTETVLKAHQGVFTGIWGPSTQQLFACSMIPMGMLERAQGSWQPMPLPVDEPDVLSAIRGIDERDVYCVGAKGLVLHYNGRVWRVLEVPTTRNLRCIESLGDRVCIGGEDGILLYGNSQGFRLISSGAREAIRGLGYFQGEVYFGMESGVWRFDGLQAPRLALDRPAWYVTNLNDGLFIQYRTEAWTWDGTTLLPLDTVV